MLRIFESELIRPRDIFLEQLHKGPRKQNKNTSRTGAILTNEGQQAIN